MAAETASYYVYDPSKGAAIAFAIFYTCTFIYTLFQYILLKSWFWIFTVLAAAMESVGYIGRVVSTYNTDNRNAYIIQFVLFFLAPALMAASCYMAMGRVIVHATPSSSRNIKTLWVLPRWMTPIFVTCDVIAFLIQVFGATSATSKDPKTVNRGYSVMKVGLAIQLACFGFFLVVSLRFHIVSKRFQSSWPDTQWRKLLMAINVASVLIFARSIYRMVEFTTDFDGYLSTHEWNFYVFEAVSMLPVLILFNVHHPAKFLTNVGWRQQREKSHLPLGGSSLQDLNARSMSMR
ncbi:putative RTM1-like protein [Sclerotinia borealis F-4128]|uniref:Putative RTM1-like protein n=1 Tax=Sclerotinia borealis (strain F-4128) TaxID=1432307 RepID=W9CPG4_SCLBF|nr:putative RTM1-like protein [Sclerotinia borealis F-4128]